MPRLARVWNHLCLAFIHQWFIQKSHNKHKNQIEDFFTSCCFHCVCITTKKKQQKKTNKVTKTKDFCSVKFFSKHTLSTIFPSWMLLVIIRPVGRGGSRGFARTPLVASKGFFIHHITAHFKCPTVGNWSTSSLAAIENHRKNKSGCSCTCLFIEDQRRAHT